MFKEFKKLAEKKEKPQRQLSLPKITVSLLAKKLENYCADYNPDLIVCTHVFAAQLATEFEYLKVPTIGVITDFTIHPFWEDTRMDYYVTASELLENQARKKLGKKAGILPFGIPINQKFSNSLTKQEARKVLGIEDKRTVFIISGSMGFGNIVKHIKQLDSLDIDFLSLSENANATDAKLDEYCASLTPSKQNEYTVIFEGKNLIMITAEAFTKEVIDPDLTPTLYRLMTKGIQFQDYYQPASAGTTGGEYHVILSSSGQVHGIWAEM